MYIFHVPKPQVEAKATTGSKEAKLALAKLRLREQGISREEREYLDALVDRLEKETQDV